MVIIKTKISTITAVIATIVMIAALGSIGGGMGLGQQQMALATVIGEDEAEIDVGDIGDRLRDTLEQVGIGVVEREENCPPPLIHVRLPVEDPELFICVDSTFDQVPIPDFP